jgi:hypothetical protein
LKYTSLETSIQEKKQWLWLELPPD